MKNFPFYTEEHEKVFLQLKDLDDLAEYKNSLSQNVDISLALCKRLQSDIDILEGDASDALKESTIGTLVDECETIANEKNHELNDVQAKCVELHTELKSLKDGQNSYLTTFGSSFYETDEKKLKEISYELNRLTNECSRLRNSCDSKIADVDAFNEAIADLTAKLFSLSLTLGDVDFSGFRNLSTEEKERLIQNFIDSLRKRYDELTEYKNMLLGSYDPEKVEKLNKLLVSLGYRDLVFSDERNRNASAFSAESFVNLMEFLTKKVKYDPNNDGNTKERTVMEVINGYFDGEEWVDSGMHQLYCDTMDVEDVVRDIPEHCEREFIKGLMDAYSDDSFYTTLYEDGQINGIMFDMMDDPDKVRDIINKVKDGYNKTGDLAEVNNYVADLDKKYGEYNDVCGELAATNTTVYSFENLKKQLPYFEYAGEEAFETFEPDLSQYNKDWLKDHKLDQGITDGYDYNELFNNMSDEEKMMFAYCIERNGGTEAQNLAAGRKFLRDSADRINQRVGFNKAQEFVDWINDKGYVTRSEYEESLRAAGTYTEDQIREMSSKFPETATVGQLAIDEICDLGNCFVKGTSCGFNQFTQNIQNLWEPDKVMTVNEYETSAIMSLFGDERSEDYRPECLASFNCGQTIGKDGIKTVLKAIPSPVTKGIGTVLDIADRTGAARNKYYRESGDYTASFYHASFDAMTDGAIDYLAKNSRVKDIFNGLGSGGEDALKFTTGVGKILGKQAIDRTFDFAEGREVQSTSDYLRDSSKAVVNVAINTLTGSANNYHTGNVVTKTIKDTLTSELGELGKNVSGATITQLQDEIYNADTNLLLARDDLYTRDKYEDRIAKALSDYSDNNPDYGTEIGKFTVASVGEIAKGNK